MTRYVSKPAECEAMQWAALPNSPEHGLLASASQIVAWVNANGGEARYENSPSPSWPENCIAVRTINGWAYAAPGHYIVMGEASFVYDREGWAGGTRCRAFDVRDPKIFESHWEAAP